MALLREFRRIAGGVLLIATEAAKQSPSLDAARAGDFGTLFSRILKNTILSATDLAGLTSGKVREFSPPRSKESVVYFTNPPEAASPRFDGSTDVSVAESPAMEMEGKATFLDDVTVVDEVGNMGKEKDANLLNLEEKNVEEELVIVPLKKRRNRERRVPSTPFSRALGSVKIL